MEVVKNKLNSMKAQSELSEERIVRFESALRTSKQHLEAALKEKESLYRKIEAVEAQIINADRQRGDVMDRLKDIDQNTDSSECRRKVLENRELEGDDALIKLEDRLRTVQEKYAENSVQCEEGNRRLSVLTAEFNKLTSHRLQKEERAAHLESEIDETAKKLRGYEDFEMRASQNELKQMDHMKLLESYLSDAEEKKELGRMNIMRLRRLTDQVKDEIELVQMRTKATKVELHNTIQTVVNN